MASARPQWWARLRAALGATDHAGPEGSALAESPALRHLADALPNPDAELSDLLDPATTFSRAPDPSAWLQQMRRENDAMPTGGHPLSVLSYNVGLLSRRAGPRRFEVPHPELRRPVLPHRVLDGDWDVVLLQEVWEPEDVDHFARLARARGYAFYAGARHHPAHGLMMMVRRSIVASDRPQSFGEHLYRAQRRLEGMPGLRICRGYLTWSLTLAATGTRVVLVDTHTTAFVSCADVRIAQAYELGEALARMDRDAVVIVGGDLNAAAYYPWDEYGRRDGRLVQGWWRNAISYPLLLHFGGLRDAVVRAGRADDVGRAGELPTWDESFREVPFGGRRMPDAERTTFTVTDANSLYHRQYGGSEYPARIDHVLLRDPDRRARVTGAEVCFTDPLEFRGRGRLELSDHYGVGVTLEISA